MKVERESRLSSYTEHPMRAKKPCEVILQMRFYVETWHLALKTNRYLAVSQQGYFGNHNEFQKLPNKIRNFSRDTVLHLVGTDCVLSQHPFFLFLLHNACFTSSDKTADAKLKKKHTHKKPQTNKQENYKPWEEGDAC